MTTQALGLQDNQMQNTAEDWAAVLGLLVGVLLIGANAIVSHVCVMPWLFGGKPVLNNPEATSTAWTAYFVVMAMISLLMTWAEIMVVAILYWIVTHPLHFIAVMIVSVLLVSAGGGFLWVVYLATRYFCGC